jgi:hypothetical protein
MAMGGRTVFGNHETVRLEKAGCLLLQGSLVEKVKKYRMYHLDPQTPHARMRTHTRIGVPQKKWYRRYFGSASACSCGSGRTGELGVKWYGRIKACGRCRATAC